VRVLLTGAAGFIGSAVGAELIRRVYEVVGIDAWIPPAHGGETSPRLQDSRVGPGLSTEPSAHSVALRRADVRDPAAVRQALRAVDVVCH
jgi:dTDP-L-rhamnose 4-epimerase